MDTLKILVVDDEARMRKLVKDFLTNKGFAVIEAGDGEEAVDVFFAQKGHCTGSSGCNDAENGRLGSSEDHPQIFPGSGYHADSQKRGADELQGFSLGVDEYISKPFSPKILVARVEAILRRTNVASTDSVNVGGICIDKAAHQVTIDGQEIDLSFKEFELHLLCRKSGNCSFQREDSE